MEVWQEMRLRRTQSLCHEYSRKEFRLDPGDRRESLKGFQLQEEHDTKGTVEKLSWPWCRGSKRGPRLQTDHEETAAMVQAREVGDLNQGSACEDGAEWKGSRTFRN